MHQLFEDICHCMSKEEIYCGELSNGLKWIFVPSEGRLSHAALMFGSGSRNEADNETGLAHFTEHNLFKGTAKKTSLQVLSRIDSVGGELNAYTAKEETCIYASCFTQHLSRALELLSDIGFFSEFPEEEIVKEKKVVLDEIMTYEDNPSDQIFDEFDELVFGNHPIGKNILGTRQSVNSFRRKHLKHFTGKHFRAANAVISISGNHPLAFVKKLISTYFGELPGGSIPPAIRRPTLAGRKIRTAGKDIQQDYVLIGGRGPSYKNDADRLAMVLLNNLLGGPSLNNRLNLAIREKYGLTYSLESSYQAYNDCGMFTVFFATDSINTEKTLHLVYKELDKLVEKKMSERLLETAKKQLCGSLAMSHENRQNATISMAKSMLVYGKYDDMDSIFRKIQKTSAEKLHEVAGRYFNHHLFSTLQYTSLNK